MHKSFVIEIKKGGEIAANFYYATEYKSKDDILISLINWVDDMITGYNLRLASVKTLYDVPLAIRILQEENEEGTLALYRPIFASNSNAYVSSTFANFEPYGNPGSIVDKRYGTIGVVKSDIEVNRQKADIQAIIDFDDMVIEINYDFETLKLADWLFSKKPGEILNLRKCPYNFRSIVFNDLIDVYDFVCDNKGGFVAYDSSDDFVTVL